MNTATKSNLIFTVAFLSSAILVLSPIISFAAWVPGQPIVPACGLESEAGMGPRTPPCNFNFLVILIGNIISFLVYAGILIAVAMFAYAGFKYLTAGSDTGQIKAAREIFFNVGIGLIIVLVAWLIVDTIFTALVPSAERDRYLLKNN